MVILKSIISDIDYIKNNRVAVNTPLASTQVAKKLANILKKNKVSSRQIIILCIGTDRSTGDSLGPLVGSKLSNLFTDRIKVFGSLTEPVHAVNLEDHINYINKKYTSPFIIAVDACLGKSKNVGKISIEEGPIKPGTGVNKVLPEVGDCHVAGTVNVGGFMEFLVLQNTRLKTVIMLSITISKGIILAVNYLEAKNLLKK